MKHILVVDNNIDPPHGAADIVRSLEMGQSWAIGPRIPIVVKRGPEATYSLDVSELAGVVLSGSKTAATDQAPWIMRQMEFLRALAAAKIPTFGICYGEQLMAKAFGGEDFVRRGPNPEFGLVEMQVSGNLPAASLLRGLPRKFVSFCWHYDEATRVPQGFVRTVSSALCPLHCLEHESAPMWGVQFHPERNLPECLESIARIRRQDPAVPVYGTENPEKLFDPRVAEVLFSNFIAAVRSGGLKG